MIRSKTPVSRFKYTYLSVKVVLLYIIIAILWLLISTPLARAYGFRPLLHTGLILYFVVSSVVTVSVLLQRERALAESRHEYYRLLHALVEPVVIHTNGAILDANQPALDFFEAAAKDELIGSPVLNLVHPDYRDAVRARVQQLSHGESTKLFEEKFLTLKGNIRDVEATGIPLAFDGKSAILVIFKDITEQKQQQMALQDSERRLRTLIDAMPDQICFMDHQARWIEANRAILDSVGLQDDTYRGKTARELADLCHPQLRDDFLNSRYDALTFTGVTHFNHESLHSDGTFVAHEVTRVPVKKEDGSTVGLVVIARNVSEQRLAVKKLIESEQRYRSLFDNDGDMVVSVDIQGIIASANPSSETTLGYAPEQLVGRWYRELIAPEHHEASQARFLRILEGEPQDLFVTMIRRDGRPIEVHEKKIPTVIEGKVSGFFWIVRDMTEQKIAEDLIIQSERLSAVGQLAAGVAHEVRNPLTTLKGFVQLMQTSETTANSYLQVMKEELVRIESIVNELLVFAKPKPPVLGRQNCAALVKEVIDLMSPETHLRNITFSQSIRDDSLAISCDKNRIKQVMVNLIKNSMEAMPEGGSIDIDIRSLNDNFIVISIRDNGPGIPEEVLAHIEEPFYTTKDTGTGLGLAVSRKIVEDHHGMLRIRSEIGTGTEAEIIFPVS